MYVSQNFPESQDFGEKYNNNFKKHTEDFLYMDLGFMENGPASLPDVLRWMYSLTLLFYFTQVWIQVYLYFYNHTESSFTYMKKKWVALLHPITVNHRLTLDSML